MVVLGNLDGELTREAISIIELKHCLTVDHMISLCNNILKHHSSLIQRTLKLDTLRSNHSHVSHNMRVVSTIVLLDKPNNLSRHIYLMILSKLSDIIIRSTDEAT